MPSVTVPLRALPLNSAWLVLVLEAESCRGVATLVSGTADASTR
jgi:hypothetical protein